MSMGLASHPGLVSPHTLKSSGSHLRWPCSLPCPQARNWFPQLFMTVTKSWPACLQNVSRVPEPPNYAPGLSLEGGCGPPSSGLRRALQAMLCGWAQPCSPGTRLEAGRHRQPPARPTACSHINISIAGRAREHGASGRDRHGWWPGAKGDLPHAARLSRALRSTHVVSPPVCPFKLGVPGPSGPLLLAIRGWLGGGQPWVWVSLSHHIALGS